MADSRTGPQPAEAGRGEGRFRARRFDTKSWFLFAAVVRSKHADWLKRIAASQREHQKKSASKPDEASVRKWGNQGGAASSKAAASLRAGSTGDVQEDAEGGDQGAAVAGGEDVDAMRAPKLAPKPGAGASARKRANHRASSSNAASRLRTRSTGEAQEAADGGDLEAVVGSGEGVDVPPAPPLPPKPSGEESTSKRAKQGGRRANQSVGGKVRAGAGKGAVQDVTEDVLEGAAVVDDAGDDANGAASISPYHTIS